jgi:argininosuccinate lyase
MSIARTANTGGELDPAFAEWSSSLPIDRRLLRVDCEGSIAHVTGLVAAGLLTPGEGATLKDALGRLPDAVERGETELPDEEDVHMAVETWLRRHVGAVADKLHTGRSRNDQIATDLKLWCREAVRRLRTLIDDACVAAARWQQRHGNMAMPAYTHRQVAVPVLARLWVDAAVVRGLARDRALLDVVDLELAACPLGAGAVGATTLPIDPTVAARALGFEHGPLNPVDAVGERDHAILLVFVCARLSMHLARFAADVVELCSDGLCRLGGSIACGSSMMPHKRNPDLFELVRGQAALRHGDLAALIGLFHGLGTGYHRDLQHDKQVLFAAVDGTSDALRMVVLGLAELELVPEACLAALAEGDALATDLTEALVVGGMPFRDAYQRIGQVVLAQRSAGRRLADLTAADLAGMGLPEQLLDHLDVAESARCRSPDPP